MERNCNVRSTGISTHLGESTVSSSAMLPTGYIWKTGAIGAACGAAGAVLVNVVQHYWIDGEDNGKSKKKDKAVQEMEIRGAEVHVRGEKEIRKLKEGCEQALEELAKAEAKDGGDSKSAKIEVEAGDTSAGVEVEIKTKKKKNKKN